MKRHKRQERGIFDRLWSGGLERGESTAVMAGEGEGKTSYLVNVALRQAEAGVTVGLFTLEESSRDIARMLLAIKTRIPLDSLWSDRLSAEQKARVKKAREELRPLPLALVDQDWLMPNRAFGRGVPRAALEKVMAYNVSRHGWQVVLIDSLMMIEPLDSEAGWPVEQSAAWAASMARRYDIHVVVTLSPWKVVGDPWLLGPRLATDNVIGFQTAAPHSA